MTREEATALVNGALDRLVQDDFQLLDLKLCERALHFKIAHYMAQSQSILPPLTLDCEYNRHLRDEKRLGLFGHSHASKVFPNILVHERNSDAHNMVALEIKRPGQSLSRDRENCVRSLLNLAIATPATSLLAIIAAECLSVRYGGLMANNSFKPKPLRGSA